MTGDGFKIFSRLVNQWEEVVATLQRMHPSANVLPNDCWSVFQADDNSLPGTVGFILKPVVFNLPERADDMNANLYVVVEGRLSFERDAFFNNDVLQTHDFATQAAYFRRTKEALQHVFGAHYDFSRDELGHPVFHAQMRSFSGDAVHVQERYSIEAPIVDCVEGMLKTVRLPTAQMDVFSLFLQICADHLLYSRSSPEQRAAFGELLQRSTFLQGAGFQFDRLGTDAARLCYRARHWYSADKGP